VTVLNAPGLRDPQASLLISSGFLRNLVSHLLPVFLQNQIFRLLQNVRTFMLRRPGAVPDLRLCAVQKARIQVMLYENTAQRIEGVVIVRALCTGLSSPSSFTRVLC
jgi:hypothetical protein